jgi:cytochrome c oxidase subunit III
VSEVTMPASEASAQQLPVPPAIRPEKTLSPAHWGIAAFLLSEAALFSTLITTYLTYLGADVKALEKKEDAAWAVSKSAEKAVEAAEDDPKQKDDVKNLQALAKAAREKAEVTAQEVKARIEAEPTPANSFAFGLVIVTTILLLSSSGTVHLAEKALHRGDQSAFCRWWGMTVLLGASFLAGTGYEWWELIHEHHVTISRNLFGTTYYTLVGFHGLHVTGGVIVMAIILGLALKRQVTEKNQTAVQMVSWYWHFVDVVWVVVFTVVYVVGR